MNEVAMYTPRQVAEVLMISRSSVYDLIGQGVIPSVKIGRSRRVPRGPFHGYIRSLMPTFGPSGETPTESELIAVP